VIYPLADPEAAKREVARVIRRRHTPTYLLVRSTVRVALVLSMAWVLVALYVPGVPR